MKEFSKYLEDHDKACLTLILKGWLYRLDVKNVVPNIDVRNLGDNLQFGGVSLARWFPVRGRTDQDTSILNLQEQNKEETIWFMPTVYHPYGLSDIIVAQMPRPKLNSWLSAILEILSAKNPTNLDDVTWAAILGSTGLSPLFLVASGLLRRVYVCFS